MGSQAIYNALAEAPAAVVVDLRKIGGGIHVAERGQAEQLDRRHGGLGPVTICYVVCPGLPYRTMHSAMQDAELINRRNPKPFEDPDT